VPKGRTRCESQAPPQKVRSRPKRRFNAGVDVLCYTPAEFEALRSEPTIVKDAAEHGLAPV